MDEKRLMRAYPDWRVSSKIGQGSFGTVYEITRELFGTRETAALKVISFPQNEDEIDELYSQGYDEATIKNHFQNYLTEMVREYSLMSDLKGHTNIVHCEDICHLQREDGIGWDIFIKMELLTPILKALEQLCHEEEIIKLGRDICYALVLCKERGIVHRDIKPQNIFVTDTGDYKLGDFGIAKTADRTVSGTKIGTFNYMAPEVYNYQPYGSTADIYSLGLVLYWLLNEHRLPFLPPQPQKLTMRDMEGARQRRFCGETIPAPKNGSDALKAVVLKACAFQPQDRYQSAQEMLEALQVLLGCTEPTQTAATELADETAPDDLYEKTVRLTWGTRQKDATAMPETAKIETRKAVTEVVVNKPAIASPKVATVPKPAKKKAWPWIACASVVAILVAVALFVVGLHTTAWVPLEVEYANGTQVRFTYDKKGQLSEIMTKDSYGDKTKQKCFYNKDGDRDRVITYENGEEVQRVDYTYEDGFISQMVITRVTKNGADESRCYQYHRDRNGKLLRSELFDAEGKLLQEQDFTYDAAGRCIQRLEEHFTTQSTMLRKYTYNNSGYLAEYERWFNDYCTVHYAFSYDQQGRPVKRDLLQHGNLKSSVNYNYDDNGNLVEIEVDGKIACTITYEKVWIRRSVSARLEAWITEWIEVNLLEID